MWFSVSVRRQKKALTNLIVNPKRRFYGKVFLKSVLFLVFVSSQLELVLLWLGFLPWVFQGSMRKKSQPSKVNRLRLRHQVLWRKIQKRKFLKLVQEFQKLQLSSPYQSWGKASASRRRPALFLLHLRRATGTEATAAPDQNRVAEDIVQDRERDF